MHVIVAAVGYPLALLILLAALPLQALLFAVTRPFDPGRVVPGRFLRFVGVALSLAFPPWRLRVEGRWPAGGPFVVVANHQSILDILLLSRLPREMKWVAKASLFAVPWAGWMLRLSGDIPVRRGDPESGGEALARARAYLDRGVSVMLFPEGTRSTTGDLLPFKTGAFRLALEAGVPVLPVAVSGTGAGMPKGGPWVRPCRAVARILEPIAAGGRAPGEAPRLRDEARARIAAGLAEIRPRTTA
ncbi:MAG TPA: lysophospholipid acyltransferase family protein [Anaeromyxobacteraceae bacterium]|nr:lysophospholipid acyltransferase family protein [Anaeromyxobacteraceae bacterium]